MVHAAIDVMPRVARELSRRHRRVDEGRQLAVPDQRVPLDGEVVLLRIVHNRVRRLELPAVRPLRLQRAPLHFVFGRDGAEVVDHELGIGGITVEQRCLHGDACAAARPRRGRRRREHYRLGLGLVHAGPSPIASPRLARLFSVLLVLGAASRERLLGAGELERRPGAAVVTAERCKAAGERNERHAQSGTDPNHQISLGAGLWIEPEARS
jgi:hypothetical protein